MNLTLTISQAKHARPNSPYLISVPMQIKLNIRRAYQRIWGDVASTATQAGLNVLIALIVGSIYFGQSTGSSSFQGRGSVIFLAILFNALTSIGEISGLYSQRPIVEKHNSYAFYHPSTEAIAGIVADIPMKFLQAVVFNIILYFLAQLRYTAGQFFLFFVITYMATIVMAAIFRTTAAVTKTASQAMAGAGVLVLILVIYTGFVIRIPQMPDWFGWLRWISKCSYETTSVRWELTILQDPLFYAFEILMANEFHGIDLPCDTFVPSGPGYAQTGNSFICNTQGAVAGQTFVNGDSFIEVSYSYSWSHVWRNFGIVSVLTRQMYGAHTDYYLALGLPHLLPSHVLHRRRDQLLHLQYRRTTCLPPRTCSSLHATRQQVRRRVWRCYKRRERECGRCQRYRGAEGHLHLERCCL